MTGGQEVSVRLRRLVGPGGGLKENKGVRVKDKVKMKQSTHSKAQAHTNLYPLNPFL